GWRITMKLPIFLGFAGITAIAAGCTGSVGSTGNNGQPGGPGTGAGGASVTGAGGGSSGGGGMSGVGGAAGRGRASGVGGAGGGSTPFEPATAQSTARKVKNLLTGMPPSDSDVATITTMGADGVKSLIDMWTTQPDFQAQFRDKMIVFFRNTFQQTGFN